MESKLSLRRNIFILQKINTISLSYTDNTHTATLEDYKLSSDDTLLYTPEALNSIDKF